MGKRPANKCERKVKKPNRWAILLEKPEDALDVVVSSNPVHVKDMGAMPFKESSRLVLGIIAFEDFRTPEGRLTRFSNKFLGIVGGEGCGGEDYHLVEYPSSLKATLPYAFVGYFSQM